MTANSKLRKLFLDANVIVKILNGYKVDEVFDDPERNEIYISTISLNIICYLWENNKINCQKSDLDKFFRCVRVLPVNEDTCFQALQISNYEDIEDGLQIGCAIENDIDLVLTYDKKMFQKYNKIHSITLCK